MARCADSQAIDEWSNSASVEEVSRVEGNIPIGKEGNVKAPVNDSEAASLWERGARLKLISMNFKRDV